jgi:hypothetical protein
MLSMIGWYYYTTLNHITAVNIFTLFYCQNLKPQYIQVLENDVIPL